MAKDNEKHFITFHNDCIPMIKEEFEKNHQMSNVKGKIKKHF
jgi:hypothetical protein